MFCNKCGAQLPEDASFCPNCGVPVEQYENHSNKSIYLVILLLFILVFGLLFASSGDNKSNKDVTYQSTSNSFIPSFVSPNFQPSLRDSYDSIPEKFPGVRIVDRWGSDYFVSNAFNEIGPFKVEDNFITFTKDDSRRISRILIIFHCPPLESPEYWTKDNKGRFIPDPNYQILHSKFMKNLNSHRKKMNEDVDILVSGMAKELGQPLETKTVSKEGNHINYKWTWEKQGASVELNYEYWTDNGSESLVLNFKRIKN